MRSLLLSFAVVAGLATGIATANFGCDSADEAFDCHAACDKYKSCIDSSFDVSACTDRCRAAAAHDSSLKAKADDCEKCINDKSCTGALSCTATCAPVIAAGT